MSEDPKIQNIEVLSSTRLFSIESVDLHFANGEARTFERLMSTGQGAVMVVPLIENDQLLLIREFAVGMERYELGFVKGRIDNGEAPEAAARRELREETGFDAKSFKRLATVGLTPAYSNYQTHIFLADELFSAPLPGDEPEAPEKISWPLADLDVLRRQENFSDSRSVLATFLIAEELINE